MALGACSDEGGTQPVTTGGEADFPNLPAGLTPILDEQFEEPWSGACQSGWTGCAVWRPQDVSTVTDGSAPSSTGTRALRTALPAGTNGGVLTMEHSFGGSYDVVYVSYWVKWDPGYDHNGTSEKLINFGDLRWWTNGQPRADHQGVTVPVLDNLYYNDTWGGGGSKGDSGGRISARLYVAGSH